MRALCLVSWLLVAPLVGCSSGADIPCETDAQCYADQFCSQGFCAVKGGEGGGGGEVVAGGPCAQFASGACQDVYEDPEDRDDERFDAKNVSEDQRRVGCDNDEELIVVDASRRGTLCSQDVDFSKVQFIECRDRDFELTLDLETEPLCNDDVVVFDVYFNGARLVCGFNENVGFEIVCDPAPSGQPRRVLRIPRSGRPSVNTLYFGVGTLEGLSAGFDYSLSMSTREITIEGSQ